jgi:hypothetical protein
MGFFKGIKDGFLEFGQSIAAITNWIFLLILYVVGVGLTSLVAKIIGKHFLNVKLDKGKKSHYEHINMVTEPKENYYRQF